jgi:hypothetical protein
VVFGQDVKGLLVAVFTDQIPGALGKETAPVSAVERQWDSTYKIKTICTMAGAI